MDRPGSACRRGLLLIGIWLWVFALSSPTRAAFEYNDSGWEGTSELLEAARKELGRERVELVAELDWSKLGPGDGVLVLHPVVELEFDQASAFMRAGGRVAVLDDHGKGAEFLRRFQIERIRGPLRPGVTLRGNNAFAIAVPAVRQVAGHETGRHPIVAEVQQLVTNHPSGLTHNNLTPILEIGAIGEPDVTLAITGIIGDRGRLFAMGDPSAVINLMLRYPGNRQFALGLVRYLVEDDSWGPRGGKLYLVANRFKQSGSYGGAEALSDEIGDYVRGFEEMLNESHEEGLPDIVSIIFSCLLGLVAIGAMARLATRSYRRLAPRYARKISILAQGGLAGRAAVLAAPSTHKALALLELRSALLEGLAHRLRLEGAPNPDQIFAEIDRKQAVDAATRQQLEGVMRELSRAEAAVLASQPLRISAGEVVAMRNRVIALLEQMDKPRESTS